MSIIEQLHDIQAQIKKLEKQRDDLNKEIEKQQKLLETKLQKISNSMGFDLVRAGKPIVTTATRKGKSAKAKKNKMRTPAKLKYRDSDGNTWTGRGLTPKWLKNQIATGKSKDDFLI